jgi:hypothetical protein
VGDARLRTVSVRVLPSGASRSADREALRAFVAEVTGTDNALVRVDRRCPHCGGADHGRPLARVDGLDVGVSLARTTSALALAVGPPAVGVDVERPSRVGAAALDAFTPAERRRAERADAVGGVLPGATGRRIDTVDDHLAACWTVKEAVLKRDGRGLRVDPLHVEAVLGPLRDLTADDAEGDHELGQPDVGADRDRGQTDRGQTDHGQTDHGRAGDHARLDGADHPVVVVRLDADLVLAVAAGGLSVHVQDLRGPDLRGPGLRGPDLRGPGLRGPGLRGSDLRGPGLRVPDLRGPGLPGPGA